jgi:uncharacterized protein (DUF885 family)
VAIPGQALSYKNRAVKIMELRKEHKIKWENNLISKISRKKVLESGVMPLAIRK